MSPFRFAQSEWVHLLWGVVALAGVVVALELRRRTALDGFVSRAMQARLVVRQSLSRRLAALGCAVLAWTLLVFALMRPQWGRTVQQSVRVGAQVMVCLDVSKSMLAEDVAPSRLERAKIELDALLGLLDDGEQVGLIAFAGKAAVLCPLTTDFGFLRLVLADVEPSSVGVGGTQLGVAIRQAVEGFRDAGDVNRLLLLLTDGEDHDSYPIDAARAAREKGVKIVCIGFGDEAGSKIEVTDPRSGARSFLKDRDGREVVSRLDGGTLREIATITEGAYVPAGTGALDLESIYRAHIATLLHGRRGQAQQVMRQEAYQWVVLAALGALLVGLLLSTDLCWPSARTAWAGARAAAAPRQTAVWAALLGLAAGAGPARAQPAPATQPPPAVRQATSGSDVAAGAAQVPAAADTSAIPADLPPRSAYNRAVALVRSDPTGAEQYLNFARREAGSDGELRYRALYNLGWVEVVRADSQLPDRPDQALPHLQQAANRFREAIRIRPDSAEARHNLELVSQRILALTDSLAQRDRGDLARRLDALIGQVRAHQAELRGVVEQAGEEVAPAQAETHRAEFRRLGAIQRPLIADLQRIAQSARQELDALNAKPVDQKSPADRLRSGQLTGLSGFLDDGLQRLNQSRSLTRRLQANRAFRRWSLGLSDIRRARDQLRDPVDVLGPLLADSGELAALTRSLASAQALTDGGSSAPPSGAEPPDHAGGSPAAAPAGSGAVPAWLSRAYLQEEQAAGLARTRALEQLLAAVVASRQPGDAVPAAGHPACASDAAPQQALEDIQRALAPIRRAVECLARAESALGSGSLESAVADQTAALAALADAWECFFDIRRLIEVLYHDEQVLRDACSRIPEDRTAAREVAATMAKLQRKNRGRTTRLDTMLEAEQQQAASAADASRASPAPVPGGPGAAPPSPPADPAQPALLARARSLAAAVTTSLDQSLAALDELAQPGEAAADAASAEATPPRDPRWADVAAASDDALRHLAELRRLFFSLVEHLRDTAQRQAELIEQTTEQSAAPPAEQTAARIGPLGHRERQLQQTARALAAALTQQSAATTAPEAAKQFAQAAELVNAAQEAMGTAAQRLDALAQTQPFVPTATSFQAIAPPQRAAREKLAAAIALLDPRQPPPDQSETNGLAPSNAANDQRQETQDQQRQPQNLTASQMLQLIRDREAQRREDRQRSATSQAGAVDKDW